MSKTYYSKKFIYTGLSFNKTALSQEDNEKTDFKNSQNTNYSWYFLTNFKGIKNLKRTNSFQNIHKYFSPNKYSPNYVPISDKNSIIGFNKAPTLRDNLKEINRIIKKKKLKQIKDLNNIFNTILINESKLFRSNLYITGGGLTSLRKNTKSFLSERNKSNDYLFKNIKYKSIYENNNSSFIDNLNINFDTGFNSNSLFNESNLVNDTKKKYRTQYPLLNNSKSMPRLNIKKVDGNNSSTFRNIDKNKDNNINITRMRMEINDAIFNNSKLRGEFAGLQKKMIKFKVFQNIQDGKMKKLLDKEEKHIEKINNKFIKYKDLLEKKYIIYSEKMSSYIDFLILKIKEMKNELIASNKVIKDKNNEIEKITLDIIKKQSELELLVDKRNFLLQIKQKYKNSPSYYEELLIKDSRKLFVGNELLKLEILKHTPNQIIFDFIDSVLEIKRKIKAKILNIDNIKPDFYINSYFFKEQVDPIFNSVDEFINLYNHLKDKSIKYLKKAETEKKSISKIKKQLEENNINKDNYLENEIIEKEKVKRKIIHKNKILIDTYNHYKDNILKKINDIVVKSYNFQNQINLKRFINIDNDLNKKYNLELKKYKYGGILLLKKLIQLITFFKEYKYDKSDYYLNIFDDKKLEMALNVDINEFNDDNITLIDRYLLKLLSKYEKICKYILNKQKMYLLNEKNKEIMMKKKKEINDIKRKEISKEIKNLIQKKKNEEIKKIIEKSNKPIVYIPNKIFFDRHLKRDKIKKKDEKNIELYNKEINLENEFNNLAKY